MQEKSCSKCGYTLSQFYKTGMLGCPYCYKDFKAELLPVLNRTQGATEHIGKSPISDGFSNELLFEYSRLKQEKEDALLQKNFQKSIALDEEIIELEFELKKRGLI